MARKIIALFLVIVASIALVGCSTEEQATEAQEPAGQEVVETLAAEPTKDSPIVVDAENKRVLVYAEVNRKWVTEPTRHGVVTAAGSNGDKAIFRAGGDALDFNKALFEIGGTAGENVKKDSPAGTQVDGSELEITVAWSGREYNINDLIVSTGELGGQTLAPKFGGNYDFQAEMNTGCLFCLDSCAAGITSNANVGTKSFDTGKVEFRGNGDKLPPDGTGVVIAFSVK